MVRDTYFLTFWRGLRLSCRLHGFRAATIAEATREWSAMTLEQRARSAGAL